MRQIPGTVSRILWHFTGGPKWNGAKSRQESRRKPASEAYAALLSILRSKELRLGEYREVAKVRLAKFRRYNKEKKKTEELRNHIVELRSFPVCCLSDIPVAHLSYHSERYGKLAIGFHREAAVRHGFNPVFYTLHDAKVLRSVRDGFARLRQVEADEIDSIADDVEDEIQDLECEHGHHVEVDVRWKMNQLRREAEAIGTAVSSGQRNFGSAQESDRVCAKARFRERSLLG